jgi:3-methyladenine DNA glycosylase AlkD
LTPQYSLSGIRRELGKCADAADARFLQRFFKTGAAEYGAGDRFRGIRVPEVRRLARRHRGAPRRFVLALLRSPWHEERLLALLILVAQFRAADTAEREAIRRTYLAHMRYVNNWDLVDASAPDILGASDIALLERLARSASIWERRIAIMSTFGSIREERFGPTLRIAKLLLRDPHDLIHKAVGWMLREVGKRDRAREEAFLRRHCRAMPRTMLRYAIEHFPEPRRQRYLRGQIG